jgi:hypothetical protein
MFDETGQIWRSFGEHNGILRHYWVYIHSKLTTVCTEYDHGITLIRFVVWSLIFIWCIAIVLDTALSAVVIYRPEFLSGGTSFDLCMVVPNVQASKAFQPIKDGNMRAILWRLRQVLPTRAFLVLFLMLESE